MVESIAAQYYVRLLNQTSVQVDLFDHFTSIELTDVVNGVGSFAINFANLSETRQGRFVLDGQVEVYRSVPGVGLDWYVESAGFFRKSSGKVTRGKDQLFSAYGVGYNSLLERTNIAYKQGTIRADKYDVAETVMKEYVEENCGPTASTATAVGRIRNGVFPYFFVQSDQKKGPLWSGSKAFENLLDTLNKIADYSNIDFEVVRSGNPGFTFVTYLNQLGADRTTVGLSGEKNAAGNAPVIFSIELGNAQESEFVVDRLSEVNVVYVLGEGDGSTRDVIVRAKDDTADDSPWNRIEVARPTQIAEIPGLSEEAAAELKTFSMEQTGDDILAQLQGKEEFTIIPLQQPSTLYGKHYFLGDRVTLRFAGQDFHKRIISRTIQVQGARESIQLELATIPRTI